MPEPITIGLAIAVVGSQVSKGLSDAKARQQRKKSQKELERLEAAAEKAIHKDKGVRELKRAVNAGRKVTGTTLVGQLLGQQQTRVGVPTILGPTNRSPLPLPR